MSIERYSVEKMIGKGSYGEVFLAKHKKDKRLFVVKKVSLQKASDKERKAAELEAQLLSQLRHPNIVSYRESFQGDNGFLFIVMNYCEGGDLYTKLKNQKSTLLGEDQIVQWFVQIAMALQYMHEKHILHRDLKTQNIFLTRSKIIKLGDLGIAKVLENSSDMATTLIGTPYYMSPELFSNKPYNHKSDVWALGCCLYEMCTLRHAFNAKDMSSLVYKILKGKTPPLPQQYSADLCSIISTMLDQDPDKRPSVSRLLRHHYIKKQISKFLEGTKNRQNRKSSSSDRKSLELKPPKKSSLSSKSDSGYIDSCDTNLKSIATVSGVDCVIEETDKSRKVSSPPSYNHPKHVSRSQSENDMGRASVDSSHSSSSSSGTLEKEDIQKPHKNGVVDVKEKVIDKEAIKKQMEQRRRKTSASREGIPEEKSSVNDRESRRHGQSAEDKITPRRVHSAGPSRPKNDEAKYSVRSRPLPRPPPSQPKSYTGGARLSKSPRARRRYKISVKPPSHDEDDDDDDDKSTASIESDRSSHSVSESSSSMSGLSARERRRLKQKASGSPLPSPSISYNTPPLPSPKGIIADIQRKKSQDKDNRRAVKRAPDIVKKQQEDLDCVDGPPRQTKPEMPSDSEESGSDLEEVSTVDEPSSSGPSRRHQSEVSSLISALDTTLKMDDLSVDRVSPELDDEPNEKHEKLTPSASGRLRERIERLKLDCLQGIGEHMLKRAYDIIDSVDEDRVEDELVKVMGRDNFEKFGGQIWQLKFCESFRIS